FISGIICVARGERIKRLFTTASWPTRFDDSDVGFSKGLGGGVATSKITAIGRPDRPFPGVIFTTKSPKSDHVKWIQSRLNCAAKGNYPVLGGRRLAEDRDFGPDTKKVVRAFQRQHHLEVDGKVGRHTWHQLLAVH